MKQLIFKNADNQEIDFCNYPGLVLFGTEGLQPTEAIISSSQAANLDGVDITNVVRGGRQVLLNVALQQGERNEALRRAIYSIIGGRGAGSLRFVSDDLDVSAVAYALAPVPVVWSLEPSLQLAFSCPSAYWADTVEQIVNLQQITPLFAFPDDTGLYLPSGGIPFSNTANETSRIIEYVGQLSTGLEITIHASGAVTNPVIANTSANEGFYLDSVTLQEGDVVVIQTERGQKSVKLTRAGATTSLLANVRSTSSWPRLYPGQNTMAISATTGTEQMTVQIKFKNLYWGVG